MAVSASLFISMEGSTRGGGVGGGVQRDTLWSQTQLAPVLTLTTPQQLTELRMQG